MLVIDTSVFVNHLFEVEKKAERVIAGMREKGLR